MSNIPHSNLIIAVVVLLILIFVPPVRRFVAGFLRVVVALVAAFVAIAGVTMLMNDESVFTGKPGVWARSVRFLSYNEAATNEKGLGSATCTWPDASASPPPASPPIVAQKNPGQA